MRCGEYAAIPVRHRIACCLRLRLRNLARLLSHSLLLRLVRNTADILKTGSHDRDLACIDSSVVIHGTEDDVGFVAYDLLYIGSCLVGIHERDVAADINDDILSALDGSLEKRALYCLLYSLESLLIALGLTDTDMGDTAVGHNSLNVGKVKIDKSRLIDKVCDAGDCLLQKELFSKIALHTVSFINDHGIKAYDETTGKGVLRKIFLRSSRDGSSVVLCLVCSGGFGDCTSLFVKETIARFPEISGIVININKKTGNSVLGDKFYTLYGEPDIKDSLNGIFFNISPASFYQVNPVQAEKLYNEALSFAEPAGKTVLDLYCGAGTITLNLAKHAKTVIGSEIVPEAVENAENNAKMNGISNARFICCDCSELKDRFGRSEVRPDCIVVDPPRKGLAKDVIGYIAELSPESVVYVSCNPETLARDIRIFNTYGYVLKKITAVDMFPGTFHVETVCCLYRQ